MSPTSSFILTLSCTDRPGIVHQVTGFLVAQQANITEAAQFNDVATGLFFMRVRFVTAVPVALPVLREATRAFVGDWANQWGLYDAQAPVRTLILVSHLGHCLNELLFSCRENQLAVDVRAVVSNHCDFQALADGYGIPFHHIPVQPQNKAAAEARLMDIVRSQDVELVVLARYMQILSAETCAALAGRTINIHHSFLPGFKGAKPYTQAFARGVKLIGATAHYVTTDLDEGPIIEQDVARVTHAADPDALAAIGRAVECAVLHRAVRWHSERRVLLNGAKTVVFA